MADAQILVAGTSALPVTYGVPNAVEEALLCVNATIDGTSASGNFLATVEIVSDGGVVVARCPCFTTIPAGRSAEVSWFRLRSALETAPATSAYEELILTTGGLVLYLKQDEISGTTLVDTWAAHNGTYFNSPTLGQPPLADGTSVTYDGASQFGGIVQGPPYVDVPGINGNGQMTAEGWIKTTMAPGAGNNPQIFNSDTSSSGGRFFQIIHDGTTNTLNYVFFDDGANGHGLAGTTVINDGVKHYFACTFNGTTMNTYIDGALDATVNPAMAGRVLSPFNHGYWVGSGAPIGGGFFNGPHWAGTLDEVALYDIALTPAQVAAHFAAG